MTNRLLENGAQNALTVSPQGERELVMQRTFNAPRALVWEVLSKPEHVRRWYGPRSDTMTVCELDFRVGGAWRFVLESQNGGGCAFRGHFREIVFPEKIVQTTEFEDMPGHISLETLTLEEQDGQTTMTILCQFDSTQDRDGMLYSGMEEGAGQSYDRLEELLAQWDEPNELVIVRTHDAPRELVWRAWTEREHLIRWSAPQGFSITHCEGDLREGGAWRTCMVSPDGKEHWVGGRYLEIVPPERLVFTHLWDDNDGFPNPESRVTVTLEEEGQKTRLHFRQEGLPSPASRDGHEIGWNESFDRLSDVLRANLEHS